MIYITDKKRIIQTFHKHEIIPIIGDIPHFTINNTGKWVKLKLMYLAPTGRQIIIKKLQPEILFFTGFSCKEYLYKNMINFLKNRINEHFSSFLKIKKKIPPMNIRVCDWTKAVHKHGLDKYITDLTKKVKSQRIILIGHSWGCQVSSRFAAMNLDRCYRFILLDYHPIKKPITKIRNKKLLVDGFFPKCSMYNMNFLKAKVMKSMDISKIGVSKYILEDKLLGKKLRNIPTTLVYATGIIIKDKEIQHYCITRKNRTQLLKDNTTFFQKANKSVKILTIIRGSHFWFMTDKYNKIMLDIWEIICNSLF